MFTPIKYRSALLDGNRATFENASFQNNSFVIDLGKKTEFNTVLLREAIAQGQYVQAFTVEVEGKDGWREVARSTTIGVRKILQFPEERARKIRIRFLSSKKIPALSEVEVYRI